MMKVKLNPSFYKILDEVQEATETSLKSQLYNIARDATQMSAPYVYTGAFVT